MHESALLQPLRIPPGWFVAYNDFREVDPWEDAVESFALREDLLQLVLDRPKRVVDLGWYGGIDGAFRVICVEPDFQGNTVAEFRTRDRLEAAAAIERFLDDYGRGPTTVCTDVPDRTGCLSSAKDP